MKRSFWVLALAAMTGVMLCCGCGKEAPKRPKPVAELTEEELHAEMEKAIEEIEAKLHDETLSPGARREPIDVFIYRFRDCKDDPLYKQTVKKYGKITIRP